MSWAVLPLKDILGSRILVRTGNRQKCGQPPGTTSDHGSGREVECQREAAGVAVVRVI